MYPNCKRMHASVHESLHVPMNVWIGHACEPTAFNILSCCLSLCHAKLALLFFVFGKKLSWHLARVFSTYNHACTILPKKQKTMHVTIHTHACNRTSAVHASCIVICIFRGMHEYDSHVSHMLMSMDLICSCHI